MKKTLIMISLIGLLLVLTSCQEKESVTNDSSEIVESTEREKATQSAPERQVPATITLTINQTKTTVSLNDSQTAQDFLNLLPLTMSLTRWNNIEYYGRIDEPLTTDSPVSDSFESGDVMIDPAARNLAIFYDTKPDAQITGFIKIGEITSDLSPFHDFSTSEELTIDIQN